MDKSKTQANPEVLSGGQLALRSCITDFTEGNGGSTPNDDTTADTQRNAPMHAPRTGMLHIRERTHRTTLIYYFVRYQDIQIND